MLFLAACLCAACYEPRLSSQMPAVVEECPTLPDDSDLEWTHSKGPDFGVCMATQDGAEKTTIGIYFGDYPDFDRGDHRYTELGEIDGRTVNWYDMKGEAFGRETLLERDGVTARYAHFWIIGQSQAELDRLKVVVAGIDLARKATVQREVPPL